MSNDPKPFDSGQSKGEQPPDGAPIPSRPPPTPTDFGDPPLRHREPVNSPEAGSFLPAAPGVESPPRDEVFPAGEPADPGRVVAEVPAARPPHPGFWGALLWTLFYGGGLQLALAIVFGVLAVVVRVATSANPRDLLARLHTPGFQQTAEFKDIETLGQGLFLAAFSPIGLALGLLLIRLTSGGQWRRRIAFRAPGVVHLVLAILGTPALVILSSGVYELAVKSGVPTFHYQAELVELFSRFSVTFGVLVIAVGPALAEEFWFRGFLGRGLVARYGYVGGVLLTSFFFGLMHLDPPHVLATFVMGICLHCAYLATRSLWVPILLHFLNNLLAVLGSTVWKGTAVGGAVDEPGAALYPAAFLLGVAVGWAFYRSRSRLVSGPDGGPVGWQPDFPGVEYPPPGSGARVVHPWPGWPGLVAVAAALAVFAAACVWPAGSGP
jgi:membrane protease YdiL (CAAX protease family)